MDQGRRTVNPTRLQATERGVAHHVPTLISLGPLA